MVEVLWTLLPMLYFSGLCNKMVHYTQHEGLDAGWPWQHDNIEEEESIPLGIKTGASAPRSSEKLKAIAGGCQLLMPSHNKYPNPVRCIGLVQPYILSPRSLHQQCCSRQP